MGYACRQTEIILLFCFAGIVVVGMGTGMGWGRIGLLGVLARGGCGMCGILYGIKSKCMSIPFIIQVVQVVSAVLLIVAVLLQRGEANVGSAFGGGDVSETGNAKRRGSERVVFVATFVIAAVFVISIVLPFVTP